MREFLKWTFAHDTPLWVTFSVGFSAFLAALVWFFVAIWMESFVMLAVLFFGPAVLAYLEYRKTRK